MHSPSPDPDESTCAGGDTRPAALHALHRHRFSTAGCPTGGPGDPFGDDGAAACWPHGRVTASVREGQSPSPCFLGPALLLLRRRSTLTQPWPTPAFVPARALCRRARETRNARRAGPPLDFSGGRAALDAGRPEPEGGSGLAELCSPRWRPPLPPDVGVEGLAGAGSGAQPPGDDRAGGRLVRRSVHQGSVPFLSKKPPVGPSWVIIA